MLTFPQYVLPGLCVWNILCIELVFAGGAETSSSINAAQDRIRWLYLALHLPTCLQGRYTNVGGQNSCIRFSLPGHNC